MQVQVGKEGTGRCRCRAVTKTDSALTSQMGSLMITLNRFSGHVFVHVVGQSLDSRNGRYNIMAASLREVGEAVVTRKGGKGKPNPRKEKKERKELFL